MKRSMKRICAECGSDNVIYDRERDQLICNDCGSIFEELIPDEEERYEEVFEEEVPRHAKRNSKKK